MTCTAMVLLWMIVFMNAKWNCYYERIYYLLMQKGAYYHTNKRTMMLCLVAPGLLYPKFPISRMRLISRDNMQYASAREVLSLAKMAYADWAPNQLNLSNEILTWIDVTSVTHFPIRFVYVFLWCRLCCSVADFLCLNLVIIVNIFV